MEYNTGDPPEVHTCFVYSNTHDLREKCLTTEGQIMMLEKDLERLYKKHKEEKRLASGKIGAEIIDYSTGERQEV